MGRTKTPFSFKGGRETGLTEGSAQKHMVGFVNKTTYTHPKDFFEETEDDNVQDDSNWWDNPGKLEQPMRPHPEPYNNKSRKKQEEKVYEDEEEEEEAATSGSDSSSSDPPPPPAPPTTTWKTQQQQKRASLKPEKRQDTEAETTGTFTDDDESSARAHPDYKSNIYSPGSVISLGPDTVEGEFTKKIFLMWDDIQRVCSGLSRTRPRDMTVQTYQECLDWSRAFPYQELSRFTRVRTDKPPPSPTKAPKQPKTTQLGKNNEGKMMIPTRSKSRNKYRDNNNSLESVDSEEDSSSSPIPEKDDFMDHKNYPDINYSYAPPPAKNKDDPRKKNNNNNSKSNNNINKKKANPTPATVVVKKPPSSTPESNHFSYMACPGGKRSESRANNAKKVTKTPSEDNTITFSYAGCPAEKDLGESFPYDVPEPKKPGKKGLETAAAPGSKYSYMACPAGKAESKFSYGGGFQGQSNKNKSGKSYAGCPADRDMSETFSYAACPAGRSSAACRPPPVVREDSEETLSYAGCPAAATGGRNNNNGAEGFLDELGYAIGDEGLQQAYAQQQYPPEPNVNNEPSADPAMNFHSNKRNKRNPGNNPSQEPPWPSKAHHHHHQHHHNATAYEGTGNFPGHPTTAAAAGDYGNYNLAPPQADTLSLDTPRRLPNNEKDPYKVALWLQDCEKHVNNNNNNKNGPENSSSGFMSSPPSHLHHHHPPASPPLPPPQQNSSNSDGPPMHHGMMNERMHNNQDQHTEGSSFEDSPYAAVPPCRLHGMTATTESSSTNNPNEHLRVQKPVSWGVPGHLLTPRPTDNSPHAHNRPSRNPGRPPNNMENNNNNNNIFSSDTSPDMSAHPPMFPRHQYPPEAGCAVHSKEHNKAQKRRNKKSHKDNNNNNNNHYSSPEHNVGGLLPQAIPNWSRHAAAGLSSSDEDFPISPTGAGDFELPPPEVTGCHPHHPYFQDLVDVYPPDMASVIDGQYLVPCYGNSGYHGKSQKPLRPFLCWLMDKA